MNKSQSSKCESISGQAISAPPRPSFSEALRWWFKLGCISFGGPAGQIALMHEELVTRRRWISEGRFLHALNYCMVLPGPEAQQLATYIGWLLHGVRGGIAAGVLFVLPSLLLLIGLSWAYMAMGAETSAALLYGIKPAVVALVVLAAWRMGSRVLKTPLAYAVALAALGALAFGLPFPLLILLAAAVGWAWPKGFAQGGHVGKAKAALGPALLDDDTPTPAHAVFKPLVLVVGLLLWALPIALLWGLAPLGDLARFFTQAALVTFGGAYAVMPYVFEQAVQTYAWLTPAQMLDGLALGESTPGPLIMVVAFIGFVAGWAGSPGLAIAGALVATWFTFLPSFLFILAGAPWVERTRQNLKLAAPLAAVTAAVVAAILGLAAVLAVQVFGPWTQPDIFALALAGLAFATLYRNWLGLLPTLGLCLVAGLLKPLLLP